MQQKLIHWIVEEEDIIVPALFKPVQFNIIKKLDNGVMLTENEKRYLRGRMKDKMAVLQELAALEPAKDAYSMLLGIINSYYITGLEALKQNGYGWYYEPKIIEIINTKIQGKIILKNRAIKFIRIKSITKSKIRIDKKTGLKYAKNEQIIKDVSFTKNKYAKMVWMHMFLRYKDIFIKKIESDKFKELIPKQQEIDYAKYGI